MADTVIKIPDLPTGITLTVDVLNPASLATLETVTMTESGGIYSGEVTGAHAGQLLFRLKASGTVIDGRLRTIADDVGPYTILEALERIAVTYGAYAVTITIDDGTDPVEGARVRVTAGGVNSVLVTDVDGEVTFSLDAATYAVTVVAAGFDGYTDSLVVAGATTDTFSLTASSVAASSSPLLSTGTLVLYDESNAVEVGKPVTVQYVSGPGDAGYGMDTKTRTVNSAVTTGLVTFTNLRRGATYQIWRGAATSSNPLVFATRSVGAPVTFVVPNAGSFLLPEISGLDAT